MFIIGKMSAHLINVTPLRSFINSRHITKHRNLSLFESSLCATSLLQKTYIYYPFSITKINPKSLTFRGEKKGQKRNSILHLFCLCRDGGSGAGMVTVALPSPFPEMTLSVAASGPHSFKLPVSICA